MATQEGGRGGNALAEELGLWYLSDITPIGRGGFAYVYAAIDTRFDRRVAVKVFEQLLTDEDRTLFETECRTTGRLSAVPNIITLHDVDYTPDGRPCIVMAHIAGGSLGDHLRRHGIVPWRRAVAWLVPVLRALEEAHRNGVLHRDIKPENILVDGDRVFLTDFGLATIKAGATHDPAAANIIASPLHAPPETFDGGDRDERSDVYSAASTLYNLITGHAPFQRDADLSTEAIVARLRTQPPAHIPAALAPADLDAVVLGALAKDPAQRPRSAGELADALQAILDSNPEPSAATPPGAVPSTATGGSAAALAPSPRTAVTQSAPIPDPPPTATPPSPGTPPAATPPSPGTPPAATPPSPGTGSTPGAGTAGRASPAGAAPAPSRSVAVGPLHTPPQPSMWGRGPASAASTPTAATPQPAAAGPPRRAAAPTSSSGTAAPPAAAGTRPSGAHQGLRLLQFGVLGIVAIIVYSVISRANDPSATGLPDTPFGPVAAPETPAPTPRVPTTQVATEATLPPGIERVWADNQARVIDEITAAGWGWDRAAGTVVGPGGLLVDLATCPEGWDPYGGIEDGQVRIGQITPGLRADDREDNASGFGAYLRWIRFEAGGLPAADGGEARMPLVDNVGDSSTGTEADEVVSRAFAARRLTGATPDPAADGQNAACVPDPFIPAGGPGWADPGSRPWAWSDGLSANAEGWLLGEILARSFPDRAITVAAVVVADDTGRAAAASLRQHLAATSLPVDLRLTELADVSPDVEAAVAELAATGPDALLVLTGSSSLCGRIALATLGSDQMASVAQVVTTSACNVRKPSIDPVSATPWLTIGSPRRAPGGTAPDAWIAWASSVLESAGYPAPQSPAMLDGFASGWAMHQAMLIADGLPGGLSRPNLLLAARAMNLANPSLVDGVSYGMSGNADAHLVEGAPILRYDPASREWGPSDLGVIDVPGLVPGCVWDPASSTCA